MKKFLALKLSEVFANDICIYIDTQNQHSLNPKGQAGFVLLSLTLSSLSINKAVLLYFVYKTIKHKPYSIKTIIHIYEWAARA